MAAAKKKVAKRKGKPTALDLAMERTKAGIAAFKAEQAKKKRRKKKG